MSITRIIAISIIAIATISMAASAYQIPAEYKEQAKNDVQLYILAMNHQDAPWASYILDDLAYHYTGKKNRDMLAVKMESLMNPVYPVMPAVQKAGQVLPAGAVLPE